MHPAAVSAVVQMSAT